MIVSASITVAVELWPRRAADERVSASASASASAASPSVPSSGSTPAPAPAPAPAGPAAGAEVAAGRTVATPTPTADAGNAAEGEPAEALPVAFHIRNRRDLNLIDGDIRNVASKPLSITLRAVNASTQAVSEMRFQLAPGERRTYSSNDGLYMQANDELIVQSPPYPDRVVKVP
jgi:hypothetical protein